MEQDSNEYFKNDYTEMWIKDGILHSSYTKNLKVNLEIAKICVQARLDFTKGKTYPMLVYGANLRQLDTQAGKYLRSGKGIQGISAGAFIPSSQFDYFVMSFFLIVLNPNPPAKIFKTEESALKWLEMYKV